MGEEKEAIKNRLSDKFKKLAAIQNRVAYSMRNFTRLFPQDSAITPLGEVKVYKDQFLKLSRRDGGMRQALLGAMYQTLTDPVVIIKQD